MGTMKPHHLLNFFQNWPPDGREIGHLRGAEGGLGAVTDERSVAVPVEGDNEHVDK